MLIEFQVGAQRLLDGLRVAFATTPICLAEWIDFPIAPVQ